MSKPTTDEELYENTVMRTLTEGRYRPERHAFELAIGKGVKASVMRVDATAVPNIVKMLLGMLEEANARVYAADARMAEKTESEGRYRSAWLHAIEERDRATAAYHFHLVAEHGAKPITAAEKEYVK